MRHVKSILFKQKEELKDFNKYKQFLKSLNTLIENAEIEIRSKEHHDEIGKQLQQLSGKWSKTVLQEAKELHSRMKLWYVESSDSYSGEIKRDLTVKSLKSNKEIHVRYGYRWDVHAGDHDYLHVDGIELFFYDPLYGI